MMLVLALAIAAAPAFAKDVDKTSWRANTPIAQSRDMFEGFEGAFPPAGWTVTTPSGHAAPYAWHQSDESVFEGSYAARVEYDPDLVPQNTLMTFSATIVEGEAHLNFAIAGSAYWSTNYDVTVEIDGVQVYSWAATYGDVNWVFETHDIDLTSHVGQTVVIGFRYVGTDGAAIYLDNIGLNAGAVTPPPPVPPVNDTCAGAIELGAGEIAIEGDMTEGNNDYDPTSSGCTGYAAAGLDVVYAINLTADGVLDVAYTSEADASLYLITDCANPLGSCLIGADDTFSGEAEQISYTNDTGDLLTVYLICDNYGAGNGGLFTVTGSITGAVATEATTWGACKALFR